jgi:hypothetical protein
VPKRIGERTPTPRCCKRSQLTLKAAEQCDRDGSPATGAHDASRVDHVAEADGWTVGDRGSSAAIAVGGGAPAASVPNPARLTSPAHGGRCGGEGAFVAECQDLERQSRHLMDRPGVLHDLFSKLVSDGVTRTRHLEHTAVKFLVVKPGLVLSAQFNREHIERKRPTDMRADSSCPVSREFDAKMFHFGKVSPREAMAVVDEQPDGTVVLAEPTAGAPHVLLINVSPVCIGHGLLVPFIGQERSQALTSDALRVGLEMLHAEPSGRARLGFNSLGAWASVNHLHFHVVFPRIVAPPDGASVSYAPGSLSCSPGSESSSSSASAEMREPEVIDQPGFPVEDAHRSEVLVSGHLRLSVADGWPVPGLCFECTDDSASGRAVLATACGAFVGRLRSAGVAHSVLAWAKGMAVMVFPRANQSCRREGDPMNIAFMEICGRGIVNFEEDWARVTAASYWELLERTRVEGDWLAEAMKCVSDVVP